MAALTSRGRRTGTLADALRGADVFIGVSGPKLVTAEMVSAMAKDAAVFAMANPVPEILPEEALAGGARVVGTGRSDYPNQINNVLAFPASCRGALDVRAREITDEMLTAASYAIAGLVSGGELCGTTCCPGVRPAGREDGRRGGRRSRAGVRRGAHLKKGKGPCGQSPHGLFIRVKPYLKDSSTATAHATVAPTIGLLPMPMRPIISTCAGTEELPANCASPCMRPIESVRP